MDKSSIKQEIIKFCEGKNGFVFGGQIEDYIRDLFGAKASNASRRCRELVEAGVLQKSLVQIDGKGPRVVRYKVLESTQNPPNLCKVFTEDCYNHPECLKTLDHLPDVRKKEGIDYTKDNIYDAIGRPDLKEQAEKLNI